MSLAAIFLMAMQLVASGMAMARDAQSASLQAQGKHIVICSVHGTMVIDWDGPAPAKKSRQSCPFCLAGAGALAAKAPFLAPVVVAILRPAADVSEPLAKAELPVISLRMQERPASPRAPPAAIG